MILIIIIYIILIKEYLYLYLQFRESGGIYNIKTVIFIFIDFLCAVLIFLSYYFYSGEMH